MTFGASLVLIAFYGLLIGVIAAFQVKTEKPKKQSRVIKEQTNIENSGKKSEEVSKYVKQFVNDKISFTNKDYFNFDSKQNQSFITNSQQQESSNYKDDELVK